MSTLLEGDDDKPRYALTERGRSLAPALEALYGWGEAAGQAEGVRFRQVRTSVIAESRLRNKAIASG